MRARCIDVIRKVDSGSDPGQARSVATVCKHAVHLREHDEEVGARQLRHERCQVIVVADLDLVVGECVVFVDDRHDAASQQHHQSVTRREETSPVFDVIGRHKKLCGGQRHAGEGARELGHQQRLTDGRGSLARNDFARRSRQTQKGIARGHRARDHENHLESAIPDVAHFASKAVDGRGVQLASPRNHGTADLDDDSTTTRQVTLPFLLVLELDHAGPGFRRSRRAAATFRTSSGLAAPKVR